MTWGLEGPTAEQERDSEGPTAEHERELEGNKDLEGQRSSKIYAEYAELDRDSARQRDSETLLYTKSTNYFLRILLR